MHAQPILSFVRDSAEARLATPQGTLVLRPIHERAIRVRLVPAGVPPPESPSLILIAPQQPAFTVEETPAAIVVATAHLRASVDRASGALSFADAAGRELLAEADGGRRMTPAKVQGEDCFAIEQRFHSPFEEQLFGTGQFQDGFLDIRDIPRRLTQVNTQIAIPFVLSNRGYGLLWHNYGLTDFNPADQTVPLAEVADAPAKSVTVDVTTADGSQQETRREKVVEGAFEVARPGQFLFLLDVGATMARRLHLEIDSRAVIDQANYWLPPTCSAYVHLAAGRHTVRIIGESHDNPVLYFRPAADATVWRSPVADALDYVVFAGPAADDIIAAYRELSGPAPMLPMWAFGYIHCRERFKSTQEIVEATDEFRRRGLPMDTIVQDWMYWGRHGWNAMRFDEAHYPDPAAMVRALHERHARLMLSVWSKIDPDSEVGREMIARGLNIPGTQWVDFFNPEAAAYYWDNFNRRLASLDIDAWWQDATEPENDDLVGRRTHAGPGERMRAIYPLFVNRTVHDGLRAAQPDRRVFILSRSAFAGQQRYASATWSGDVGNDWETLRRQIAAGLNLVATGLPYWTTDTGGFFRPGPGQFTDAAYAERLIRWMQFSTFCPLQRIHGYQTDTEPWRYGAGTEAHLRRYLELRSRLVPYIYSEAWRVTSRGGTLMRPLVMDFPDDGLATGCNDQFMFGPAFLVTPVLGYDSEPFDVWLPRKPDWFDFWTGEKLTGGRMLRVIAPLGQIPLFVRMGSIVPLGPVRQYVDEKPADPIELRIYPGADGAFTLYEDDGVSHAYERGERATIAITWDEATYTLTLGAREGRFPGMLERRTFRVVLVRADTGAGLGDQPSKKATKVVAYDGTEVCVMLPLPRHKARFTR